MFELIVDDREKHIIPHFTTYGKDYCIKIQRINIGDYAIMYNGYIIMVIERKSWKDLSDSLRDGRKENVKKLIDLRNEINCQVAYLIEGKIITNPNRPIHRIPYKNLQAHLDHISFRDGIHMVRSENESDTARRIIEVIDNYSTIKPSMVEHLDKAGNELSYLISVVKTPELTYEHNLLRCLPCVGTILSDILLEHKLNLSTLFKDESKLRDIKYDDGKSIGDKRISKIQSVIQLIKRDKAVKCYIKILSCIPGISDKSAKYIANKYKFSELIKMNEHDITLIKRGDESTIGPKIGGRIKKYIG